MVAGFAPETLLVVWLGAFLGAFAAGGAGFAFALAASSVWLHVLDPLHTTAMVVASGTLLHGILIWPIRRSIEIARLWPFVAGAAFGIPAGVALLSHTRGDIIRAAIGLFLVAYGLYALIAPQLPYFGRGGRAADAMIGFAGGVLGGLGGYSGVLPTIWTQVRGWPKEVARGVYQPFIVFAQIVTLAIIGTITVDRAGLILFATTVPPLALGASLGLRVYGRLNDRRFRQVLAAMLLLSGLTLFA
ncbi:MAG: sulfite exporter TauE/SafE family protein [Methylobacteriaceae bacterium]|nr:sulfite exporter TauE/SafE family protein [Methylobacteriaceae bacterium]